MIGIGIGINRLRGGAADPYIITGFSPKLVFDPVADTYRTGGNAATFAGMIDYTGASNKTMTDSDGVLKWAPHNLLPWSEDFSNAAWTPVNATKTGDLITATAAAGKVQNNTTVPAGSTLLAYVIKGTADVIQIDNGLAGANDLTDFNLAAASFTLRANNSAASIVDIGGGIFELTVTRGSTAGNRVSISPLISGQTVTWSPEWRLYRSDLGGMADNPDTGNSYVPTTSAARYLSRRNHHIWNGSAWVNAGMLVEPTAATNLLLNTATLSTQNVTVTAQPYTLHFTGTGTVTLLGASTAGPLVGTGTGENNRVNLTFTPIAGTLTVTVTGTVTNAQLEAGSVPSSYIPTAGSTATRAAETRPYSASKLPYSATGMSFRIKGRATYADLNTAGQQTLYDRRVDANNRITVTLDTDGAKTGTFTLTVVNGGVSASVATTGQITPGINKAFAIAWRVTPSQINIALNGAAATAVTSPGVPSLAAVGATMASTGTRELEAAWDVDLGDSGILEASA